MPPSAIIGTRRLPSASATIDTAVICGTPTPATMRVVQIEPGPMPTLTASAPASTSASAASPVAMLPPMTCMLREALLDPAHAVDDALRVAVRGVDDDDVHTRLDQRRDARLGVAADTDRRADAQAFLGVLAGVRVVGGLLDVLDRDHAAQLEDVH
jgi:hypothetical protein